MGRGCISLPGRNSLLSRKKHVAGGKGNFHSPTEKRLRLPSSEGKKGGIEIADSSERSAAPWRVQKNGKEPLVRAGPPVPGRGGGGEKRAASSPFLGKKERPPPPS